MLPLLAPLFGSLLGPSLFSALGMSGMAPWLASGLGSGIASLATTRDPQQALMSGLLTGGLGALSGGLFSGGADAAAAAANPAAAAAGEGAKVAANPALMAADAGNLANFGVQSLPGQTGHLAGKEVLNIPHPGNGGGGLSSILGWAREHPMMAAGALALPALLPNEAPVEEEKYKDIPENFPNGPGPRAGYDRNQPVMQQDIPDEYYLRYGRPSAEEMPGGFSGEWQFFPDKDLRAPTSAEAPSISSGNNSSQDDWKELMRKSMIRRLTMGPGFAAGGLIQGPGGPTDDMVQAMGPGNMPIRLSAGEYVMPAAAVQNAGGPAAMDQLRARLLRAGQPAMRDGGMVGRAVTQAIRSQLYDYSEEDPDAGTPRRRLNLDSGSFQEELPTEFERSARERRERRRRDPNESEGLTIDLDSSRPIQGRWRTKVPQ